MTKITKNTRRECTRSSMRHKVERRVLLLTYLVFLSLLLLQLQDISQREINIAITVSGVYTRVGKRT